MPKILKMFFLLAIMEVLLQQILQLCKGRIGFVWAVTAVLLIEVLSALNAQTLAIGFADRVDGNFQHGKFAQEFFHIEVGIFGQQQTGFGDRTLVKGVQLGKFPIEFLDEIRAALPDTVPELRRLVEDITAERRARVRR